MIGEKQSVPKLTRQYGFYDALTSSRTTPQKTKYRWVWMMRNEDVLLWRVYAKSERWFYSYLECKQDALRQDVSLPSCTAVRLYIEIFNNGFENVVEISSKNDPNEEHYISNEEEDKYPVKYRWEWQISTPENRSWRSYIKTDTWFDNFEACKEDGRDFTFDSICKAALRLNIQVWYDNDCILETYYDESELKRM